MATDHGGFQLKEDLKKWLAEEGVAAEDLGAHELDGEDDYPDFILPLAKKVSLEPGSFGIISGRTGNGEAILANKVKGIRAAVCLNEKMALKSRDHNNANILSLPGEYVTLDEAKRIVKVFLNTPFSHAERHIRRIGKITQFETAHEV